MRTYSIDFSYRLVAPLLPKVCEGSVSGREVLVPYSLRQLMLCMRLLMISDTNVLWHPTIVLVLLHPFHFEVTLWPKLQVKPVKSLLFLCLYSCFHVNAASLVVWAAHYNPCSNTA